MAATTVAGPIFAAGQSQQSPAATLSVSCILIQTPMVLQRASSQQAGYLPAEPTHDPTRDLMSLQCTCSRSLASSTANLLHKGTVWPPRSCQLRQRPARWHPLAQAHSCTGTHLPLQAKQACDLQDLLDQRGKQLALLVDQAAQRPKPTGRTTPLVRVDLREASVLDNPSALAPGGGDGMGDIHEEQEYLANGQ